MTQINISMDEQLKGQADILFQKLGLSFSDAVKMFITQAVAEGGIPFSPEGGCSNHDRVLLARSIAEEAEGKIVEKTMIELRAMEE